MDELGGGKWRVRVLRAPLSATTTVRVLEDGVSLPVARGAAISWRQRNGGIGRGIR